ncbi:MAG: SCO family protein [Alphaproteobacteria bacterium]|nr:SCO family protein [Alphaproteobacteria bacterium]
MRTIMCLLAMSGAATFACADNAKPKNAPTAASAPSIELEFAKLGLAADNIALVDDNGAKIQWGELKGQPRAVFFGFTHCPVICPVTVWELDAALSEVGQGSDRIKVNFVSLDPARDTPAVLHEYFSGFKSRVVGLSGTAADIKRLAKSFDVTFEKVVLSKDDYTLDHTAAVFLIDSKGRVVDTLAFGTPRAEIVARLRKLISIAP